MNLYLRRASVYEQSSLLEDNGRFRAYVEAEWVNGDGGTESDWDESMHDSFQEAWAWAVEWEPNIGGADDE